MTLGLLHIFYFFNNCRLVWCKIKSGPWGHREGTLLAFRCAAHIFSRGVNHFYVSSPRVVAFCVRLILITAEQNRFSSGATSSFSLSPRCVFLAGRKTPERYINTRTHGERPSILSARGRRPSFFAGCAWKIARDGIRIIGPGMSLTTRWDRN